MTISFNDLPIPNELWSLSCTIIKLYEHHSGTFWPVVCIYLFVTVCGADSWLRCVRVCLSWYLSDHLMTIIILSTFLSIDVQHYCLMLVKRLQWNDFQLCRFYIFSIFKLSFKLAANVVEIKGLKALYGTIESIPIFLQMFHVILCYKLTLMFCRFISRIGWKTTENGTNSESSIRNAIPDL